MWKALTKNGQEVSELTTKWSDIQDNVKDLILITPKNQVITLPKNMEKYVQFKTASANMDGKGMEIESRTIGFQIGSNIVKIRVNEKTNNISVEIN